jgi:BirA family biotin operon repressor/biotin-[acetyl-CoA-carboxylase] ligase
LSYSSEIDLSILQEIPSDIPRKWRFLSTTDSTNAEIERSLSTQPPEEDLVVIADSQTKGKGRLGRVWHSEPKTGIYLSTLIRPNITPKQLPFLTLMAGLATVIAVNEFIPQPALLKWPNDLLLKDKKIAGILCEYHAVKYPAVIIGIGINVNQIQFPTGLKDIATSLKLEFGKEINRTALVKSLIVQLDIQYNKFKNNNVQALIDNWARNTDLFGKTVSLNKGNQITTGKAIRLDTSGRLVILTDSGKEVAFDSGEVKIE